MSEFLTKKVTFSISCSLGVVYAIRELHENKPNNPSFSRFLQQILQLGIAKYKEIETGKRPVDTSESDKSVETSGIPAANPRTNDSNNNKRIVTRKINKK